MSDFQLTPAQKQAVDLRGKPILVSAAAGSGKTRVLTERLMARVLEGEDIRRFLVITFTRAAAAELRARILTELNARLAEQPADAWLRRQSAYLYRAQIGTIDSFCGTVVRENAHLLGISPGFTTLDEERAEAMRVRALDDVLDRAYEKISENDGLRLLVDSVGAGRDDARLASLVLDLHGQLRSRAWPEKWAEEHLAALAAEGISDAGETVWGRYLLSETASDAAFYAEELEAAVLAMSAPEHAPFFSAYIESFSEAALWYRDVFRATETGWDPAGLAVQETYPALKRTKKDADELLKIRVKAVWDAAREHAKKLPVLLAGSSKELLRGIRESQPALEAMLALVSALDKEYAIRKRRADACDFSDLEHFCVQLLCDSETGGATPLADALSSRFAEVMVDEYQDVNEIQELLFRRVSEEGQHLFMVGDVKQSIYRFRLAEPEIFNRKLHEFADDPNADRVLLRENFRSRSTVIEACNAVFERIMSPALGDIEYNDEARLVYGAQYPPDGDVKPELCVLDPDSLDDGEDAPDKRLAEARYVASRIRAMVVAGERISDENGGMRPVRYGDIAILLRTPNTSGAAFRRALTEAGVPVCARQGGAFFTQPEVSFALSMLAVVDNPRQDVPLIAALRGLPFGFTPDELTAVRTVQRGELWDALVLRAQSDEKCARFISLVRELRELSREEPTELVLRWLYDRTGLLAACAVLPDALRRQTALMQLYEYARLFEKDGNRGLFRFLSWLQALEDRGLEPPVAATPDSVQILSIHKSKGLEYPVVFLADNSHQWKGTGSQQILCHSQLGLGMRMTDAERGVSWPTLPWRAISRMARREDLSEQERVLYVGMTRAQERLIMTCVQKNAAEKIASFPAGGAIPPQLLAGAQSAAPWLMRAAAADAGNTIDLHVVRSTRAEAVSADTEPEPFPADPCDTAALTARLNWIYPYAGAVELPSKLTATGVKRTLEAADPEARELDAPPRERQFRKPVFGQTDAPLSGSEFGVAVHLVMQHIDFAQTGSSKEIAGEIDRLRLQGFLDERQAKAVLPEDILAFFRSDLGQRTLRADRVLREFPFSILCPASQWYPDSPREEILLQGIVDCCIEEAGTLTIIDFKTDLKIDPTLYTAQLGAYAEAMERILKKPVRSTVLWYIRKRTAVDLPREQPEIISTP